MRSTRGNRAKPIELTAEHLAAAARHRRIVVNLDTGWGLPGVEDLDPATFVDAHIDYLTGMDASQVDSIWWCWGDMNYAPYPSKILAVNHEYQRWCKQGLDPLPICGCRRATRCCERGWRRSVNRDLSREFHPAPRPNQIRRRSPA
ncbi:MAG: hypothetical protein HOC74_15665 [Gemmatimonadetes bacterium]|jgi:hypothetical protein|nr:hypothetical protein [Gemmatimonadota bacterium]